MSVREELDLGKRVRVFTIYDKDSKEVCKVWLEEGGLEFYAPLDPWALPKKEREK